MIQNLTIKVDATKPLSQYGDGHIIVYDSTKGTYYATSRESFLKVQNDKISSLEARIEGIASEVKEKVAEAELRQSDYEKEMNARTNEFLSKYKETNSKMIALIKTITTGEI